MPYHIFRLYAKGTSWSPNFSCTCHLALLIYLILFQPLLFLPFPQYFPLNVSLFLHTSTWFSSLSAFIPLLHPLLIREAFSRQSVGNSLPSFYTYHALFSFLTFISIDIYIKLFPFVVLHWN